MEDPSHFELRDKILSDVVTRDVSFDNVVLSRFLTANKGNSKKAFQQYQKSIEWRKETIDIKKDLYASAVPPSNHYFGTRCLQAFHGIDRRPIIIERTGMIPYDSMLKDVSDELLFERHIWQMEELNRRCAHMSKITNSDIHQFVLILDLTGFNIQMSPQKINMF